MTALEITPTDPQAPDPEGVAAAILAEPTSDKPKKNKGGRPRKKPAPEAAESNIPAPSAPITDEEKKAVGGFLNVLWKLSPLTQLQEDERDALALATIPVLRKYLPKLGGFEAEAALLLTAGGLIATHWPPPKPKPVDVTPSSEIDGRSWSPS